MIRALHTRGLLHSDILGSILTCRSPRLFAAYRVLLRLLMPRHPPCALISLNASLQNYVLFSNSLFSSSFPARSAAKEQFKYSVRRSFEIVFYPFLKFYFIFILRLRRRTNWIFLHFLFVVSLFNFQRSSFALRHLKSLDVIWWRLRESNP